MRSRPELVEARAAFDGFIEDEHEHLFKAPYSVTESREGAEDISRDAFLALWDRWDDLGGSHLHPSPGWGDRRLDDGGQLQRPWIVDVDGVPLAIDATFQPDTSGKVQAAPEHTVGSVRIHPR